MSSLSSWATIDPKALGTTKEPYAVQNMCEGKWTKSKRTMEIIHPLDRDAHAIYTVPDTQENEIQPFIDSLRKVSKSGLHNPLKRPERYVQYGEITRKVRHQMFDLSSIDQSSNQHSTFYLYRLARLL